MTRRSPPSAAFEHASRRSLVCIGASVRGFACSATLAGWSVHATDLFGDRDLRSVSSSFVPAGGWSTPYPASLADIVAGFPDGPWCYTGALENHPEIIDRIAAERPLAGNPGHVLRTVRDPAILGPAVLAERLRFPDTFPTAADLPRDGSFLLKPLASGGGRGIRPWHGPDPAFDHTRHVWQRLVAGADWAVSFACQRPMARCWGVTRQLVGRPWCHADAFAYCGSIAVPAARVPPEIVTACERLGRLLVECFGLVGLVGVDLVVDSSGQVHVIEVNPRPTASMELAERATDTPHAAVHLAACGIAAAPPGRPAVVPACTWGKAVLFAAHETLIDPGLDRELMAVAARWTRADGRPALADVPPPGARIAARRPILTLFARGTDEPTTRRALRRRASRLCRLLLAGQPAWH